MIKNRNIIFLLFAATSILLIPIFYYSWNGLTETDLDGIDFSGINSTIDKCIFSDDLFVISGWAYPDETKSKKYYGETYVIVKTVDGYYKVRTKRTLRKDVSSYFNLGDNADNSGFSSGYNFEFSGLAPENEFYIVTESNGVKKGVKRVCK